MMSRLFLHSSRGCSQQRFSSILLTAAIFSLLSGGPPVQSQPTFDSGSTGADGELTLTTPGTYFFDPNDRTLFPTPIDLEGDNIYNFTTITIGAGVILRFSATQVNAPIFWLASGAVQINGTLDLNGEDGRQVVDGTKPLTLCVPSLKTDLGPLKGD